MIEIGDTLGNLTVLDIHYKSIRDGHTGSPSSYTLRCVCGKEFTLANAFINRYKYCCNGCPTRVAKRTAEEDRLRRSSLIRDHGEAGTRLYRIWQGVKARCKNVASTVYRYYGKKGISYCEAWDNYKPFAQWSRENGYADNLELDRIDGRGNYEPGNCRWLTKAENLKNRVRPILPCSCNSTPHKYTCPVYRREATAKFYAKTHTPKPPTLVAVGSQY